jgi:hypothetical protein
VDEMDGLQVSNQNQAWIDPYYALTVGIPSARIMPLLFGIYTRFNGRG